MFRIEDDGRTGGEILDVMQDLPAQCNFQNYLARFFSDM